MNYRNNQGVAQPPLASSTTFTVPDSLLLAVKTATLTDIYAGEITDYALTLINVGAVTAHNVEVLDTLPSLIGFVPGTSAPAPDGGWAPNPGPPEVARWTSPALAPGATWTITLGGRALPPGALPQVAANSMRVHWRSGDGLASWVADSAPVSVTVRPVTPPAPPFALSAGPAAGTIALAWTPSAAGTLPVSGYNVYRASFPGLVPGASSWLAQAAGATASVHGDSSAAAGVPYCYIVRAVDVLGNESADSNEACTGITPATPPVTPPVTPPPAGTHEVVVGIMDTSGRIVRTLRMLAVEEGAVLRTVGDGTGRAALTGGNGVAIVLSDGTRLVWDGRDSSGRPVPNGIYTVRASTALGEGREAVSTATIAVTRAYERLIEAAVMVPNPASEVAWVSFRLADTTGTVAVRVYNVAGELVLSDAVPGTSRSYRWNLRNRSGQRVSAGLYVIVLEAVDSGGAKRDRAIMKLAVEGVKP